MSSRERRDDVFASPARARSLLTVRAAISFARFVDAPCSCSLSLMCSYCRSRFALQAFGIGDLLETLPSRKLPRERGRKRQAGLVLDVVLGRVRVDELVDDVEPLPVRVVDRHERLPLLRQRVLR